MGARLRVGTTGLRRAVVEYQREMVRHWDCPANRTALERVEAGAPVRMTGEELWLALIRSGQDQDAERFCRDRSVYVVAVDGEREVLSAVSTWASRSARTNGGPA